MGGGRQGFTLISVLFLMVVFGIVLMGADKFWSTAVKREKEAELLFRGDQIRASIKSYYHSSKGGKNPSYPKSLKSLLKDSRYLTVRRHLRKKYKDPMTADGEWGVILDSGRRIKGVFSKSKKKPLKIAGFPVEYEDFEKAKSYSDWRFVYEKKSSSNKKK